MVRITQIKIPVSQVAEVADQEALRHGILSAAEKELVLQETAGILKCPMGQIRDFEVLRRSVDARRKNNMIFSYLVQLSCAKERQIVKRCKNRNIQWVESTQVRNQDGVCFGGQDGEQRQKDIHRKG